jgi:hypothetical protein
MHETANDMKQQAQSTLTTAKSELSTELDHARELTRKLSEVIKINGRHAKRDSNLWQSKPESERPLSTNWDQEV